MVHEDFQLHLVGYVHDLVLVRVLEDPEAFHCVEVILTEELIA